MDNMGKLFVTIFAPPGRGFVLRSSTFAPAPKTNL